MSRTTQLLCLAVIFSCTSTALAELIEFDVFPDGTPIQPGQSVISTQFASLGVERITTTSSSGPRVTTRRRLNPFLAPNDFQTIPPMLVGWPEDNAGFNGSREPVEFRFEPPARQVTANVEHILQGSSDGVILDAFDTTGQLIATDAVSGSNGLRRVGLNVSGSEIARARLRLLDSPTTNGAYWIDSLQFSNTPEAPAFSFTRIAASGDTVPDGQGQFTGFGDPVLDNGVVAFEGVDSMAGRHGIYVGDAQNLEKVVDSNTPVPGGIANFSTYLDGPAISGANIAFYGQHPGPLEGGASARQGVYARIDGALQVVADGTTPIAGGGYFTGFAGSNPSIDDEDVAFIGTQDNVYGVFARRRGVIERIADTETQIPNGPGTFTHSELASASISRGRVAFGGSRLVYHPETDSWSIWRGVYTDLHGTLEPVADNTTPLPFPSGNQVGCLGGAVVIAGDSIVFGADNSTNCRLRFADHESALFLWDGNTDSVTRIVDSSMPIPDGIGRFTNIGEFSFDGESVAFSASDATGQSGIYWWHDGEVRKVIDAGDSLDGREIAWLSIESDALDGTSIAFLAAYDSDNTQGVYVATLVPEPSSIVMAGVATLCFLIVSRLHHTTSRLARRQQHIRRKER